jgi:predicted RNase H-like HicB family nuclease
MDTMKLQVELFFDNEVDQWGYTVPALSIVGTGCDTREEAERFALEAVEVTLESGDEDFPEESEVITYDVRIAKAS